MGHKEPKIEVKEALSRTENGSEIKGKQSRKTLP
jgi:hypothetical protein